MSLDLRVMHVKPGMGSRVWDVKLMDERQNARVYITPDGAEFIDLVIIGGQHYHPRNFTPPLLAVRQLKPGLSKSRRRKLARAKRAKNA